MKSNLCWAFLFLLASRSNRSKVMFLSFFGLNEQPFGATPDPKYLYWSHTHREALSTLYYGIKTERGFLALIAPPGFGKTTLVFQMLERLRDGYRSAFLFQTRCSPSELLRFLLADLGCDTAVRDPVELHLKLNGILAGFAQKEEQVVFVIDEAQNLTPSTLETVRLISNFEKPERKLIQIVLSGQPQLSEKLASPGLMQLRQRISMVARLLPLNPLEIREYIEHRLRVAGYQGPFLFKPDALEQLIMCSEGIPRLINSLCFNSLSLACARHVKLIDQSIMQEAIADSSLQFPHHRSACSVEPTPESAAPADTADRQITAASKGPAPRQAPRLHVEGTTSGCSLGRPEILLASPIKRHGHQFRGALSLLVIFVSLSRLCF